MKALPYDRMGMSIRLMLGIGMRTQEIMTLEPKHIEEDGSRIHIRQAVTMVKGSPRIGLPKTKTSYLDIPVPSPHCCRHTYASQLQGVPLETIQSLTGHADVDMTEHYLHIQKEVKEDAAQNLNSLFKRCGLWVRKASGFNCFFTKR